MSGYAEAVEALRRSGWNLTNEQIKHVVRVVHPVLRRVWEEEVPRDTNERERIVTAIRAHAAPYLDERGTAYDNLADMIEDGRIG